MSRYILIAALLAGSAQGEEIDFAVSENNTVRWTIETAQINWQVVDSQLVVTASGFVYSDKYKPTPATYLVAGCADGFGMIFYRIGSQAGDNALWRRGGNRVYDGIATNLCQTRAARQGRQS